MTGKIREEDLIKHLNELEEAVEKGDALQSQDPEGGFSTEGKALSGKSKAEAAKAMSASDASDDESADDASADDGSEEDAPPVKKCKKGGDESDDESDDAGEEDDTSKSFRERADEDETMQKAIEVSDFIEATVDNLDAALKDIQKGLGREIVAIKTHQGDFNRRLAKAVVSIGNEVREMKDLVKSLSSQPHIPQRKAILSKSEVVEPAFGGHTVSGLESLSHERMQDWLIQKAVKGEIDPVMVTVFEQNGYNPEVLPAHIKKALVNDLAK